MGACLSLSRVSDDMPAPLPCAAPPPPIKDGAHLVGAGKAADDKDRVAGKGLSGRVRALVPAAVLPPRTGQHAYQVSKELLYAAQLRRPSNEISATEASAINVALGAPGRGRAGRRVQRQLWRAAPAPPPAHGRAGGLALDRVRQGCAQHAPLLRAVLHCLKTTRSAAYQHALDLLTRGAKYCQVNLLNSIL